MTLGTGTPGHTRHTDITDGTTHTITAAGMTLGTTADITDTTATMAMQAGTTRIMDI